MSYDDEWNNQRSGRQQPIRGNVERERPVRATYREPETGTAVELPSTIGLQRQVRASAQMRDDVIAQLDQAKELGYFPVASEYEQRVETARNATRTEILSALVGDIPTMPELTLMLNQTRATHADRDRFAAHVSACLADGRLSPDEAERRIEHIHKARTIEQLAVFVADLPAIPDPEAEAKKAAEREKKEKVVWPRIQRWLDKISWSHLSGRHRLVVYLAAMAAGIAIVAVPAVMAGEHAIRGHLIPGVVTLSVIAGAAIFFTVLMLCLSDDEVGNL